MNLKEKFLDLFGLCVEKKTSDEQVKKIFRKLLPKKINLDLIRLGENGDGGYLLPNDLKSIDRCYSAGVGLLAEFEKELEKKFSINSNMLDFNDINKDILPNNSKFLRKKLSLKNNDKEISINSWIEESDKEIILKIDIEGDEYAILSNISDENLKKIRILVIELHDLRNLRSHSFLDFFEKIFSRLDMFFHPVHLHINNVSKVKKINKLKVPDMIEATLIRKDRIKIVSNEFSKLPHALDQKTVYDKNEIFLDPNWYI